MKFEVLKKDNLKRNIIIGVFVVLIISAIVLNFTRAKYRSTASIPIVNSEVNYVRPDLDVVALYIDGEQASELDSSKKYTLDPNNSTCTYKDGSNIANLTLNYDSNTGSLSISPFTTRGTKCTLYFNEYIAVKDTLLSYYPTVLTRTDFSTNVTNTTTGTIYKSADSSQYDNDGEVYYFAGNPTDNWVYFAGFYWQIIRVNGNGSIRLIYAGTSATSKDDDFISESPFNTLINRSEYVGFMYTYNMQKGTDSNSTIKEVLDVWYEQNLLNNTYIDINAGFCGDREIAENYTWSSVPTSAMAYKAFERINQNLLPSFNCLDDNNDLYTTFASNKGNKALTYPIGLITMDEVLFAGDCSYNTNYYLSTGQPYWTMTPQYYYIGINFSTLYAVSVQGGSSQFSVNMQYGVRPVINLKADVTISSGNGTSSQPFTIE